MRDMTGYVAVYDEIQSGQIWTQNSYITATLLTFYPDVPAGYS